MDWFPINLVFTVLFSLSTGLIFQRKKRLNYGTKEASLTVQNITLFSQVTIPRWDKWNDWDIFGNSTLEKQHAFERQEGD